MRSREECTLCGTIHEIGDMKTYQEGNLKVMSSPDIFCVCGLVLRPIVPIFRITNSGFFLKPIGYHRSINEEVVSRLYNEVKFRE